MPSTSNLFFKFVFSLVARCAEAKGKVAFFGCSAVYAAGVFFGPLLKRMLFAVGGGSNHDKIFEPVILGVSVFVVYMKTFWRICYDSVLVRPAVWLCDFYANIHQSILGFVEFFCANWKRHSNFIQHLLSNGFCFRCKRFIGTVRTSRRIMVSVAVKPLFAYDLSVAKRAQFEWKFFRHSVFYTNHNRIANAF